MTEPPLFIPLRTEWFRAFESGRKSVEFRAYGSRWNERTCRVGRRAIVSHGYSKRERLELVVVAFKVLHRSKAPKGARAIFPDAVWISAIHLERCRRA